MHFKCSLFVSGLVCGTFLLSRISVSGIFPRVNVSRAHAATVSRLVGGWGLQTKQFEVVLLGNQTFIFSVCSVEVCRRGGFSERVFEDVRVKLAANSGV